jgi:hypothetical protein
VLPKKKKEKKTINWSGLSCLFCEAQHIQGELLLSLRIPEFSHGDIFVRFLLKWFSPTEFVWLKVTNSSKLFSNASPCTLDFIVT